MHVLRLTVRFLFERCVDWLGDQLEIMRKESELFLGLALSISGLLSVHAGKFCDGNTADYLSCTRPSTYYYYSAFDITLVVLGAFLIALWLLSRTAKRA